MRYGTLGKEKSGVLILRVEHFIPQSAPRKSRENLVSMILREGWTQGLVLLTATTSSALIGTPML